MNFNKKYKILFLDHTSEIVSTDEKVNIILSPSLYWVKKISLPVKSIREVKKLLPSIFEETLPDGKYNYTAYKSNESSEFFIFAYEDKKILDVLSAKNISIANVQSVHFAQSEFAYIDGAIKINETQSIYLKDGVVVLIPCCWVEEKYELDLDSIALSSHKISLEQFAHIVDIKSLYTIGIILFIFIILIISEIFVTKYKIQNIEELKNDLFIKNNLKPTLLQNEALFKKYKNTHDIQINIRTYLSHILSLKLKQNEKITLISLKNRTILVKISGVKAEATSHIISTLKNNGLKFITNHSNETLHLEISL